MIFKNALNSLDDISSTIQKVLTEVKEIKDRNDKNEEIINSIDVKNVDYDAVNKALSKVYTDKKKIIAKYNFVLNHLDEQIKQFEDEIDRCKEGFAGSALKLKATNLDIKIDTEEPVFCYCQKKGRGETMLGCDGSECDIEWYHLECVGLSEAPKGKWWCDACKEKEKRKLN